MTCKDFLREKKSATVFVSTQLIISEPTRALSSVN